MKVGGKVIIVSGATSDIGRATASLLHQRGASLVVAGWQLEDLRKLERALPGSLGIPTDVLKSSDVMRLVQQTVEELGRIDGLIYCNDHAVRSPVVDLSIEGYRELLGLNLIAPFNLMRLAAPVMRRQHGGAIVNVSSLLSRSVALGFGPYASAKSALNTLSMAARKELAADNIVVSIVLPAVPENSSELDAPKTRTDQVAAGIIEVLESGAAEVEVK